MDKTQSQKIIRETFENKFDKTRFMRFIIDLLNLKSSVVAEAGITFNLNSIPNTYKPYINSFEKITSYESDGLKLDVLVVSLNKETSIERARTMQRNFIAWYLGGGCDGEQKDAALAAFVSPNEKDWRFSLIKMDYSLVEDKKGIGKIIEQFTSAKRWSFLVGSNEKSHTAQSQLIDIVTIDDENISLTQLEEAFNVEKVTKEFFNKYRELFFQTKDAIDEILLKDKKIKSDFEDKNINTTNFTKKLLGQIVFLYFLQKKGWFGVSRDANWGTGPKNFLRELFETKHSKFSNFFNDILEPLFYEALRIDRNANDDYYDKFNCKIPFLNGGLFDPIGDYDWVNTDIKLPNKLFSNSDKTKDGEIGTGILDVFDRYNFTVQEDEPLEKEVAVDPEMLGKVFENLLEVKDRKSKGTYYTPREIVHYMCQQSLINYLTTELVNKVRREDIEVLIKYGEHIGEDVESAEELKLDISNEISANASLIDEKLTDIKVCDPAVGSGAFLVGMMSEIIRTRNILSGYISGTRSIYDLKRDCIEKCLYGVDIDPGAVEICKLRLWLSLIVDEEDIKNIKPLPNLDYKIVCGNSLLGVEINLFNQQAFNQLEKLKPLYFGETNVGKKKECKQQIEELIEEITNGHKEFDFEVYFSEVFHKKKGFDIVIANPPYISYGLRGGQRMTKQEQDYFKRFFPESAEYKISLYAIFMDKALQISKLEGGLQTFIVPDSFLLGRYFSKIRRLILSSSAIIHILLIPYGVFEATVGFSVIYLFKKIKEVDQAHMLTAKFAKKNEDIIKNKFQEFSYLQSYFQKQKHNRFRLFFNKDTIDLITKISNDCVPIGNIIDFNSGLIGKDGKDSIVSDQKINNDWLPGIISGGEMNRYILKPSGKYILYKKEKIHSGYECVDYFEDKILIRQTGDSLICALDDMKLLCLNNIHVGNIKDKNYSLKYIVALINSKLLNYYYKSITLEMNRVMAQTDIETVEDLPVKKISKLDQESYILLFDKILMETKSNEYLINEVKRKKVEEYENQIDQMVYELYDLTPKEIEIVENSNS